MLEAVRRISAANTARSAQSRRGRGLVRRSTATSCRSTSSSMFLVEDGRPSSKTSLSTCRKSRYSSRSDTATIMPDHRRPPVIAAQQHARRSGTLQAHPVAGLRHRCAASVHRDPRARARAGPGQPDRCRLRRHPAVGVPARRPARGAPQRAANDAPDRSRRRSRRRRGTRRPHHDQHGGHRCDV